MSTTIVNSAIGYVFWIITARNFAPSIVGSVGALVSAATIAATLADLGLRTMLMQQLPVERDAAAWSRRVSGALLMAVCTAMAFGLVASAAAPRINSELAATVSPAAALTVVLITLFLTVYTLLDGVSVSEHRAGQIVVRNVVNGCVKVIAVLGLMAVVGRSGWVPLYATAAGFGVAALWGVIRQIREARPDFRFVVRGTGAGLHALTGSLVRHYLLNLGGWLPQFVLPLEVVALLSTQQNAYATLTWMIGYAFFTVSPSVSTALFVAGRWNPDDLRATTARAAKLITVLLLPAGLAVAIFGRLVLSMFGPGYAHYGYPMLLVLIVSAVPDAITNVRMGRLRAQGRVGNGARFSIGMAVIAIAAAWILIPYCGIVGVAWAWLISQSAGAVWGYAEDRIVRNARRPAGRHSQEGMRS